MLFVVLGLLDCGSVEDRFIASASTSGPRAVGAIRAPRGAPSASRARATERSVAQRGRVQSERCVTFEVHGVRGARPVGPSTLNLRLEVTFCRDPTRGA